MTDTTNKQPEHPINLTVPRITFLIFFLFSAMAGIFSLVGILALPPSETKNLLVADVSLRRLIFIAFHVIGISGFIGLFIKTCVSTNWAANLDRNLKDWSRTHPFQSAAVFCLTLGLIIGLSGLDFLMDPTRFPRMVHYMFLYIRMRPIVLWLLAIIIQIFSLILIHKWTTISLHDFLPENRSSIFGFVGILIVLVINLVVWLDFFTNPDNFLEKNYTMIGIVCFSLVFLFSSLFILSSRGKRKPR